MLRAVRIGLLASALLAAVAVASDVSRASAEASPCAPPELGFGAGEGANAPHLPPTVGELRIGMLFVDFSDSSASATPKSLYDAYIPRVGEWYERVSYGRLEIEVEPLLRWLRLPLTLAEYEARNFQGAVQAAIAAADPEFDFSGVDALYVVPSMPSLASTIIDHEPLRVDGVELYAWAWLATGSLERLPFVAIHETGHLLGLPDLSRGSKTNESRWDIMSAAAKGGGMYAWHRWKLGWLDSGQIVCLSRRGSVATTLTPLERREGTKAVLSRVGRAIVVVELRRGEGEDASLCAPGVLFYRVDFVAGSPHNAGSRLGPIQLQQARPDGARGTARCGGEWRAALAIGKGRISKTTAWKHLVVLLRPLGNGSYRVRVTRTK